MRLSAIAFVSAALMTTAAQATLFEDIGKSYEQGGIPKSSIVRGYWSGRCVSSTEPNKVQPAIFVYKVIKDETQFPPQRPSFSYYFENADKSDLFDRMTPKQVEAYPAIQKWFQQETWAKVEAIDGALVNYYRLSDGIRFERAVRVFENEFTKTILLRVRRETMSLGDVSTYCYFSKSLGTSDTATPGTQQAFSFGTTGQLDNQNVTAINPTPGAELREVELRNLGSRTIRIRGYQLVMEDGTVSKSYNITRVGPRGSLIIQLEGRKPFKLKQLDFYVGGFTEGLEVIGRT